MKKNTRIGKTVEVISALFIAFFVHSAILSTIRIESLKNLLGFYTIYKMEVAWAMVAVYTLIAFLLFLPKTRTIGLMLTFLLMSGFGLTLYLTSHHPHDFEGILNNMSDNQHWLFAGLSILLSLIGILLNIRQSKKPEPLHEEVPIVFT